MTGRRRDQDADEDMTRRRQELGIVDPDEPDPISVPKDRRGPNGHKWVWDTLGKGVGGALTVMLLGLLALLFSGRAYAIYLLPPRVDALELKVFAPPAPMSQAEIDRLAAAIAAALPPSPAPRKGKP